MAAKYQQVREFPGTRDQLIQASQEAAQRSGLKVRNADPASGRVEARAGFSFWSYGENVSIQVGDTASTVDVRSECLWPTQFIDWGKNKRNVTRFFQQLATLLPGSQEPPR
jgi:hypothetical protein